MDIGRLVLGTAQFGMDYGVTNRHGQVRKSEINKILSYACQKGVLSIDTAVAYADSEKKIGEILNSKSEFRIITKLPPDIVFANDVQAATKIACNQSISRLGCKRLYGLLVHRSSDLLEANGNLVWKSLNFLKKSGVVKKIGVSV